MLEVKNVQKRFGELQVLKGVSLSVDKGDVIAVLGPSGSGKTTLLRCINFLETADSGAMIFDGETFDLHAAPKKEIARLRRKTAFVFQNYNLFLNMTAMQNFTEVLVIARRRASVCSSRPDSCGCRGFRWARPPEGSRASPTAPGRWPRAAAGSRRAGSEGH